MTNNKLLVINHGRYSTMYSRHNPFVSSSSSWPLSVGPKTPRRRRRRPHPAAKIPQSIRLSSHPFAAVNRTLITLLIWCCCCAVMATLPETAFASGNQL